MDGKAADNVKKFFKKFWFLLWKDNSFKGWIFSLVFIFVAIKFIFFPLLSLVSGSSLPLAIVESCSMYHQGDVFSNFNSWWQGHENYYVRWNVTKQEFEGFRFENGFDKGDIMLVVGTKPQNVHIGDIIVFNSEGQSTPVIHRVMNITIENGTYYFSTKGDNNPVQLHYGNNVHNIDETHINQNQLVGKAVFKLAPFIGWAKLIFFDARSDDPGLCKST